MCAALRSDGLEASKVSNLLQHVSTFISVFENGSIEEQLADRAYRMHVAFAPIVSNCLSSADEEIEFVKPDSEEARIVSEIVLKEVNNEVPYHSKGR